MATLFLATFLLTMSSSLFASSPSPVANDKLNLIAKVEIGETKYLAIVSTSVSDDQVVMLYSLPTEALDETAIHITVDVEPTALNKALNLDTSTASKIGKLAVLVSFKDYTKLVGAEYKKKEVYVLDVKKATMDSFTCTGDDCPITDTAWLSSLDQQEFGIAVQDEHFYMLTVKDDSFKRVPFAILCTKSDKYMFIQYKKACDSPHNFGPAIQGFFTSKSFYIFEKNNQLVRSFPRNAFDHLGTEFTIRTTKFSDFFLTSDKEVSTSSPAKTTKSPEKTSTELATTTTKMSMTAIILIVVSVLIAGTLLIVLIITIVCCCTSKESKKRKSSSKSPSRTSQKRSKKRRSSAKKSSKKRKKSRSRSKASKRSSKKKSKRRDSKRKSSSKSRKFTKSSSKLKKSRADSKGSRKQRPSVSQMHTHRSALHPNGLNPGSSPYSSRFLSSD